MSISIPAKAPEYIACPCDHLGVVRMHGADAASFLHGQVTNDIKNLADKVWARAAYCNPKGRVIAIFHVIRTGGDDFLLIFPRDLAAVVVKRLRMYVLRAKVKLESVSRSILAIPTADIALRAFAALPERGTVLDLPEGLLLEMGGVKERYLLIRQGDKPVPELQTDSRHGLWFSTLAEDAVPEVFSGSTEEFLPQAINLDLLDAVNFRKGCYPGQEIVARLRYLGKLKQRMVQVTFPGEAREPGTALWVDGSKIGQLVLCGPGGEPGRQLGLASVNFGKLDNEFCSFPDGVEVSVHLPPYAVPELANLSKETDTNPGN